MLSAATRRSLKNLLSRAPAPVRNSAGRAVLRGWERYRAVRGGRSEPLLTDHGLPVPPPRLRMLVTGGTDAGGFLASGERQNQLVRRCVGDAGRDVATMGALLDWGAGCGRVVRWWQDLDGVAVHACDYNPELIGWVGANLPFVDARENALEPPLPYDDAQFDLVYAFSVFTHLTDELALAYAADVRRILRPGGVFFFTTHGRACWERVNAKEAAALERGETVVQFSGIAGTNLCAAYHPREWVEANLAADFELVSFTEAHTLPAEQLFGFAQDQIVLRKPA